MNVAPKGNASANAVAMYAAMMTAVLPRSSEDVFQDCAATPLRSVNSMIQKPRSANDATATGVTGMGLNAIVQRQAKHATSCLTVRLPGPKRTARPCYDRASVCCLGRTLYFLRHSDFPISKLLFRPESRSYRNDCWTMLAMYIPLGYNTTAI